MKDYSQEELSLIWLQHAPVNAWRGIDRLLQEYGSAAAIHERFSPAMADTLGRDGYAVLNTLKVRGLDVAVNDMDLHGLEAVFRGTPPYPQNLDNIPTPPRTLFVRGRLPDENLHAAAVIGARRDTRYGRAQARKIARELASNGVVIVSGLARGIDTAAHEGALEAGGLTVAVLGNGLNTVYPPENKDLADRIVRAGGALVSEYAPDAKPLGYHFPIRNRIISGLADAVILIEAMLKSGTASTVHHALNQGREVFALPGNVDAPGSELPLQLIREGAGVCTCGEDVLMAMGWQNGARQISFDDLIPPGSTQDPILMALSREEKTFEELLDETGLGTAELNTRLTLLELEGRIEKRGGRAYAVART